MDDDECNNLEDAITQKDGFEVICRKCGKKEVVVFGHPGMMGSSYTGYMEGEEGLKCKHCGNAKSWKS